MAQALKYLEEAKLRFIIIFVAYKKKNTLYLKSHLVVMLDFDEDFYLKDYLTLGFLFNAYTYLCNNKKMQKSFP